MKQADMRQAGAFDAEWLRQRARREGLATGGEAVFPGHLRPAAVLVGIVENEAKGPGILLTRRAAAIPDHGGQIAFPGGKMEEGESVEQTALREAREEIGLASALAEPLGRLAMHETGTGFAIFPVLAIISPGFVPCPCEREVEEVFTLPLAMALERSSYRSDMVSWKGVSRPSFVIEHTRYYIWGATATILKRMQERLAP